MFHNVPARRAAIKNTAEEYARITAVVARYGAHHAHAGTAFVCKRAGEASPDVHVPGGCPVVDALGLVFGAGDGSVRFHAEMP